MMSILFQLIILTSLTVLAWKIASHEDMIFEQVGRWAQMKAEQGHRIYELLFCAYCMPSVFSIIGFLFAYGLGIIQLEWRLIILYPLCVFGSSILSGGAWTLYETIVAYNEKMEQEKKYYNSAEQNEFFDLKDRKESYMRNKKKERSY